MEVSLTLESTTKVSLANRKILSNRSLLDISYLPASDNGDCTMKNISSKLDMRGILVLLLVLFALTRTHVGLVEVLD